MEGTRIKISRTQSKRNNVNHSLMWWKKGSAEQYRRSIYVVEYMGKIIYTQVEDGRCILESKHGAIGKIRMKVIKNTTPRKREKTDSSTNNKKSAKQQSKKDVRNLENKKKENLIMNKSHRK